MTEDPAASRAALVRAHDIDLYVASLFLPAAARAPVLDVLAFDAEIAKIPHGVSEPMLGEIRLQWWRDAISAGVVTGHPVADALVETIARFNLDTEALLALTEARAFDLYRDPMPSEDALAGYVRATTGTVFRMVARILAPGRLAPACVEAAGCAYGRTMLLRQLPWHVMRGQLFLPLDVLARFQLPPAEILARRNSPALRLVLNAMRARVRGDLEEMEAGLAQAAPDPALAACLPAALCPAWLRAMAHGERDVFSHPVEIARWRRQWILWRAARRLPAP